MIIADFAVPRTSRRIAFDLVESQRALIMPVGDVHFLSAQWPEQKFIKHLQWGMARGALFLGMGEYIDLASASQNELFGLLRDSTKQELADMMDGVVGRLAELMSFTKGRWIGMLEGDHRWTFADGTTSDQHLASYLGCKFLGDAALIRLSYPELQGKHPEADCVIYAHHGYGSSRLAGGQLHRLEDLSKFIEADIYLMGHSHAKSSAPIDRQAVTPDGVHYHRTKLLARTGAWMKAYTSSKPLANTDPAFYSRSSYAEKGAYMPAAMGGPAIGIGYEKVEGSKYYRPTIHYSV